MAEEYQYQPYGLPLVKRHLAYGDSDADGDVDATDNTAHFTALTTYNRKFDADFDGDVGNNVGDPDRDAWDNSYNDPAASTTMVVANRGFSPSGNPFLFTGRRLDAETGLYYYRFRTYHPGLKQFIQRDPLGYVDSASLYQYVGGMVWRFVDPYGLKILLIGNNKDQLLKEIQKVVPSVSMNPDGSLSMPDPGSNATFTQRILYWMIQQAQAITIGYSKVDQKSPGSHEKGKIKIDPSQKREGLKVKNKDGSARIQNQWEIIFHELIHALFWLKGFVQDEYCVICLENIVHQDYNRGRKPADQIPDRDPGSGAGADCPKPEDLPEPPPKPAEDPKVPDDPSPTL